MKRLWWFLGLGAAVFFIYSAGLGIPYYSDDFEFLFLPPPPDPFYYFSHPGPVNQYAYRPIEAMVLGTIQKYALLNTVPVHVTVVFLHALVAWGVFLFLRRSGFSLAEAVLAWLFMASSQAGVHAVLSNDTFSQVCGTLWGYLGLWWLYLSLAPGNREVSRPTEERRRALYSWAGLAAFSISLFSKETSVSFLLATGFILAITGWRERKTATDALKAGVARFAPYALVTAAYFVIRSLVVIQQPAMGEGRYDFHLGLNILKNAAMLAFDAIVPFSAPRLFSAVVHRDLPILFGVALASALFAAIVLYGLHRTERKSLAFFLFLLAGVCSFPVILMNHVSELYLYNMMPALSMLAGIGAGSAWNALRPWWARGMASLFLAGFFVANIGAVHDKAALMQSNGERAAYLMEHLSKHIRTAPPNGRVILLNPLEPHSEYSIYLLPGFSVLKFSYTHIRKTNGRMDLTLEIIDAPVLPPEEAARNPLVLCLREGNIEPLAPDAPPKTRP